MITACDIEIAVAHKFNWRTTLIVPNVSWGWCLRHEADMIILRPSGWAMEVEIKVTKSDIKADLKKLNSHYSTRIRGLWFAVPDVLADCEFIPKEAGILSVSTTDKQFFRTVTTIRSPKLNPHAERVTPAEFVKLAELGAMRIWSLKEKLLQMQRKFNSPRHGRTGSGWANE